VSVVWIGMGGCADEDVACSKAVTVGILPQIGANTAVAIAKADEDGLK
jgi:hypothetical protein